MAVSGDISPITKKGVISPIAKNGVASATPLTALIDFRPTRTKANARVYKR